MPITIKEAAAQLGMDPRHVRRLCVMELGLQRTGRDWLLTAADVSRLAKFKGRGRGNPSLTKHAKRW